MRRIASVLKTSMRLCSGLQTILLGVLIAGPIIVLDFFSPVRLLALSSQVNISQGYHINGPTVDGTLVVTDHDVPGSVVPATFDSANDLVGVIVQAKESLLAVDSSANQTQVATSGVAYALVSDINGSVKTGDRITVSPLTGVGMKATAASRILGLAQSDLDTASGAQTLNAKDKAGQDQKVKVGRILVSINVGFYSGPSDNSSNLIPKPLQEISNTLAGKKVSPFRIILGGGLLLIALIISVILVYAAVRSSIVSIGRNPLSQPAVRKGLTQVLGFVSIILLVTLISVYLILSR